MPFWGENQLVYINKYIIFVVGVMFIH